MDRHPQITLWRRHQRALLEQATFKAALGTGDPALFQQALARADLPSQQPEALLMLAQLQLENGDAIGALESLRSASRQDPRNLDARDRLRDLECALIKVALDKSHDAIAQARKQFYQYLQERGFGEKDQAWVGGMRTRGLSSIDGESAWAIFTTGVTGAVSGLLGRAGEEARALDVTERDMVTAYLGAQAILRLRMRDHTLAEIKAMNSATLRETMSLHAPQVPVMTLDRARALGLAIHTAFQLPELQALLSENSVDLRSGWSKGYWNPKDVGNTWAEWFGDATSPRNLILTLTPLSIGRVGAELQGFTYWTRAEAAMVRGAVRAGNVDTGTMVVARLLYWDRALGALGKSAMGTKMIRLLERSQRYQESLGLFGQAGWTLNKLVATMALQGLAVHSAEQLGGPRAALAVEAMLLFGGDTDLLIKFLDGARISRQAARMALSQFVETAERQQWDLKNIRLRMVDVEHALIELHRGKPVPKRRLLPEGPAPPSSGPAVGTGQKQAGTRPVEGARPTGFNTAVPPGGDFRQGIPNGQPGNDSAIALAAAEEGLEQGSNQGALNAAKTLGADLDREIGDLGKRADGARQLSQKLDSAPPASMLPERPEGTGRFAAREAGGHRLPAQPGEQNETWLKAERALLLEGRYDEAEVLYEQMLKEFARDAQAGKPMGVSTLPLAFIRKRLEQARGLQRTPPPFIDRAASAGIVKAIPDSEVEAILAMPRGKLGPQGAGGEIAPTVGGEFMVKQVVLGGKLTPGTKELQRCVEAEVISAELKSALGFATPGIQVKSKWVMREGRPEMESAALIYRRIRGATLDTLSPAELFHLRDQVAEHRALAILLGDYDRKADNYMVFQGVVHSLDGGQGDIRALRAAEFGSKVHPATISGIGGNDHWYATAFANFKNATPKDSAILHATFLSEISLTYQAAERGLRRVKTMLADPVQRAEVQGRVKEAFARLHKDNPYFADRTPEEFGRFMDLWAKETLEAMELRLPATEGALKSLNQRNGIPLPPAGLSWIPRVLPGGRAAPVPGFTFPEKLAA